MSQDNTLNERAAEKKNPADAESAEGGAVLGSSVAQGTERTAAPTDAKLGCDNCEGGRVYNDSYAISGACPICAVASQRAASPTTASGDERAAFEAWYHTPDKHGLKFPVEYTEAKEDDGTYHFSFVQNKWEGWQARAAVSAATKPTADLSEIPLNEGWKLVREERESGKHGWLVRNQFDKLVRGLSRAEAELVDCSLLATKPAAAPAVPEGGTA